MPNTFVTYSEFENPQLKTYSQVLPPPLIYRLPKEEVKKTEVKEVNKPTSVFDSKSKISTPDVRPTGSNLNDAINRLLGIKYVFGGKKDASTGLDCSGFVTNVYKSLGKDLDGNAQSQYNNTKRVDVNNIQPGDLVFLKGTYKSGISHVGIYTGKDEKGNWLVAEASGSGKKSAINKWDMNSSWRKQHFAGIGRAKNGGKLMKMQKGGNIFVTTGNFVTLNSTPIKTYDLVELPPLIIPEKKKTELKKTELPKPTSVFGEKLFEEKKNPPKQIDVTDPFLYAKDYLIKKGLTPHQAAGVVGNLRHESGGNIAAVGDRGTSYGVAQWHNERRDKLFKFAGTNNPSIQQQMDYLWSELNGSEKNALNAILKTKNESEAAEVFMRKFERPNAKYANLESRIKYAKNYL